MSRRSFGPDWERAASSANGKGHDWRHVPSGWVTRHCGHPTANWPYYVEHPDRPGVIVVSFNGLGWKTVAAARAAIVELHLGDDTMVLHHAQASAMCMLALTADGTRRAA